MTDTQDSRTETAPKPRHRGTAASWVLGIGALASLGAVLMSLYSLTGMSDGLDDTGAMLLALSLFSPIIIAMFAGAVGGTVAGRLPGPRVPLTAAGFTAVGLAAAGAAYALFSVDAPIALALGLIMLGSALIGGLFSLPRHRAPVIAGLLATLLLLGLMVLRGLAESSSASLFSDPLDEYGALGTIAPFLAGLACGLCAFAVLRKAAAPKRLYSYLFAGAIPGAIWLLSTIIAQVGVEVILSLGVDQVSSLDSAYLTLTFQWQYNGAMTVLFAGALCSVLAYGLLLPKAERTSSSSEGAYQSR
ncbi:hypothetical protein L0U85_10345 [Glycomyces sp. L485]|uniref:hypothetical protein n=1 Tax=Glycomyces sp. L485 TaxID=2909235 RepID=UPI001F4BC2AD|nr:hypothetical protein [Glycomyces sp. L485]MCH7231248.1 hypothetical protein [Glycomyces sp. L485]